MTWEIAVAGTVHNDDITTPHGRRPEQFGGSAIYFSLAAGRHAPVHFNGIVGRDCEPQVYDALAGLPVDLGGLAVSETPTFRWHAVHDFERWVANEIAVEQGCDPEWRPSLPPAAARAEVLFLASMRPELQLEVLRQSSARLIGADSMTNYTGPMRSEVMEVVESADILFLNHHELTSLAGESDWEQAAARLIGRGRLRAVVAKAGPAGVTLMTATGLVERPAYPVEAVIDPTGAGDALAGGFLGLCAQAERDDDAFFVEALEEGLRCAAAAISAFGIGSLRALAVAR
jgi:sugar/nucleoside kinase (ribokinase family)